MVRSLRLVQSAKITLAISTCQSRRHKRSRYAWHSLVIGITSFAVLDGIGEDSLIGYLVK